MNIQTIGVVGAGTMGHMIAQTASLAGYPVILQNRSQPTLDKAKTIMEKKLSRMVEKGKVTAEESSAVMNRIQMTRTYENFETVDYVIEAVAENIEIKSDVFKKLDEICKPHTILVSSTSTYSITQLAAATNRPEKFAGVHFFLPPIKIVELTRGYYTSDETVETIKDISEKIGKVCVEVKKDSAGYIANRIYTPLFLEAFKVYEEGIATIEEIDMVMRDTYFLPKGPFELADIIGLDVLKSGLDYYFEEFGEKWRAPQSLKQMIRAGRLGRKTGKGWYDYDK